MDDVKTIVEQLMPVIVGMRRALHAIPEPAYEEKKTSQYIANVLSDLSIPFKKVNKTGIVADFDTGKEGITIAIRADMDALPVVEKTNLPFSSEHEGYMHACGHDGHMAILLGLAMVLNKIKKNLRGKVRLIFQPAEEKPPHGGAKMLIDDGVLDGVSFIIGYHILPAIDTGKFAILDGPVMAAADEFDISIKSKGGHASCPEKTVDTILVAAKVIDALNNIVSRMIPPFEPVVISCGEIHGGHAFNVIPDNVIIRGTVRTFDNEVRALIPEKIKTILSGVCHAFGADCDIEYITCYPPLINDSHTVDFLRNVVISTFGKNRLVNIKPLMGSEDFSAYLQYVKGCYFFIGGAIPQGECHYLHSPFYDFDENALKYGVTILAKALLNAHIGL